MATDEVSAEVHDGQAAPWRRDRDFDLERMGFSLSVLDETKKRQTPEAYLRMTLADIADRIFTNANATPGQGPLLAIGFSDDQDVTLAPERDERALSGVTG